MISGKFLENGDVENEYIAYKLRLLGDNRGLKQGRRRRPRERCLKILGSLSNDNGDGNENVISKYKFALFQSLRVISTCLI